MAKKLQILRGTTAQNDAYTGSIGELTMDTEKVEVRIHDGTTQGGKTIGSGGGASLPILTHVFSDHKLNDISWLNADTFSWQSGDVYVAAYNHLVEDITSTDNGYITTANGVTFYRDSSKDKDGLIAWTSTDSTTIYTSNPPIIGETPSAWDDNRQVWGAYGSTISSGSNVAQQDTVDGISITFYRADDGHKICMQDQEANVQAIYEKTGVAWYYILDTKNKQFKLPRTKFGFTGLRDSVGGYVSAGLPNITGTIGSGYGTASSIPWVSHAGTGALYPIYASSSSWLQGTSSSTQDGLSKYGFDASRSSSVYGNSDTVQPRATQMYLYFYVGNFERDAVEQTAGITSEQLNNKADLEIFNAIYPVGSIYIGTQATCPMAIAIKGSTWELLEAGRALWTGNGSNGNTKIAAGLPNITAVFAQYTPNVGDLPVATATGAAYGTREASVKTYSAPIIDSGSDNTQIAINAARSSSVYGNSNTVQPRAYVVNVWRRTA